MYISFLKFEKKTEYIIGLRLKRVSLSLSLKSEYIMGLSLKRETPHEMFTGRTVRTSREMYGGLPVLNVNQT